MRCPESQRSANQERFWLQRGKRARQRVSELTPCKGVMKLTLLNTGSKAGLRGRCSERLSLSREKGLRAALQRVL